MSSDNIDYSYSLRLFKNPDSLYFGIIMVLTDPRLHFHFTDFGILIPIKLSKVQKVLEYLETLPALSELQWKIPRIDEITTRQELLTTHTSDYIDRIFGKGLKEELLCCYELIDQQGNFHRYAPAKAIRPLEELLDLLLLHVSGTTQACRQALKTGFCYFLGGGQHHAHTDRSSGFCLFNDLVVSIRKLQREKLITLAWIIDVDAHKGDGTASITNGDDSILTLSIHMGDAWPLDESTQRERGGDNPSLVPSDIDILQFQGEDAFYLPRLEKGLEQLKALTVKNHGRLPDLAIVVNGSDPYEKDELPSTATLRLTLAQMLSRDLLVDQFLTGNTVPAAYVNAGGYGDSVWEVYTQFLGQILPEKLRSQKSLER